MDRCLGKAPDDAEEGGNDGGLRFFPSFFDKIELYVINPHDRKTKAGMNPIYFETAPPGSESRFVLLYQAKKNIAPDQLVADRQLIGRLVETVFTSQGFGAKTAEGFGRAQIVTGSTRTKKIMEKPKTVKDEKGRLKVGGLAALGAALAAKSGKKENKQPDDDRPANRVMTNSSLTEFQNLSALQQQLKEGS
ncbi:MAG: hypothetical protein L3J11_05615, partial [Draconibacterium sp.]|nr:hypothetical protein [Draconibacterium sp.]